MKLEKVDVAIITILPEEYAAIHARFGPEPYTESFQPTHIWDQPDNDKGW